LEGSLVRVVLLAGGLGTRLSEETEITPKPMIEIGGKPILWHIMKGYSAQGFSHFAIALGYKGEVVKKFFIDYALLSATSLTVETHSGEIHVDRSSQEDWRVDLVDTGELTSTGGRVGRLSDFLPDEDFCLTYGDGVCDVDVQKLVDFHRDHGRLATITVVRPPARFGELNLDGDEVHAFAEKPGGGDGWINGGFMVFKRAVLERLSHDETSLEADVLEQLSAEGELMAYRHEGFWHCMDTLRDVRLLRTMWQDGQAPWKTWA
jgi:glucose-1-phosphate cytidylyltransferase